MKKRRHIQTRVLVTLIGMTTVILLVVGLTFNLSVRGYIHSRVTAQLVSVSESVSSDRRGGMQGNAPRAGMQGDMRDGTQGGMQDGMQSDASDGMQGDMRDGTQGDMQDGMQSDASDGMQGDMWDGTQGGMQGDTQEQIRKTFVEHPDRVIGTTGNAVVLDKTGALVSPLHGDFETASAIAAYFSDHGIDRSAHYTILSLDSGKYAVYVADDPMQEDCYLVSYVDVTAILAFTTRINLVLLVIILVTILISVILSRRFARAFAKPVQELSAFASEIGGGDLRTREFHFQDIELEVLADAMNRMAFKLDEANKKQEIFFQNVSHELRTPLTSIRGSAEGIVYNVMEPHSAAKVILSESDKLGGMVEDILYLSRMGRATPEGTVEPLDLRELLSLCVSEQRMEAEAHGVTFSFAVDDAPVLLPVREQDAQRLFGNLISNAIRYAKNEIRLTCRMENDEVVASVADDGPGISEEDLPHVFERFYKGAGGKHGIGLAIAQSVTEHYNGSLRAYNEGGAVFEVRFPKSS